MNDRDFIALSVPSLLSRYANPAPEWRADVLAFTGTQIELFKKYSFINADSNAWRVPLEEVVLRYSDYTPLGQAFIKSGEVEKWLQSCDRKQSTAAYQDPIPLEKRIKKFLDRSK